MRKILIAIGLCVLLILSIYIPSTNSKNLTIQNYRYINSKTINNDGPLGEWPDFVPIGFITAPHPDFPQYQTHLYGDWGGIVGEEFIFIQDDLIVLITEEGNYVKMHIDEVLRAPDWTVTITYAYQNIANYPHFAP